MFSTLVGAEAQPERAVTISAANESVAADVRVLEYSVIVLADYRARETGSRQWHCNCSRPDQGEMSLIQKKELSID